MEHALRLTRGSIGQAAALLGRPTDRLLVYEVIWKYELEGLVEELRAAKTPDQIRIERARKELQSHG